MMSGRSTRRMPMVAPRREPPCYTASDDASLPSLEEARMAAERRHIRRALDRTGGEIGQAARLLGISRTTLWEKMRRLGISGADL